jgi:hypothetical protein
MDAGRQRNFSGRFEQTRGGRRFRSELRCPRLTNCQHFKPIRPVFAFSGILREVYFCLPVTALNLAQASSLGRCCTPAPRQRSFALCFFKGRYNKFDLIIQYNFCIRIRNVFYNKLFSLRLEAFVPENYKAFK